MAAPVVVVASGGMAVSEATLGTPVTPSDNGGLAVTLLSSGGVPVIFIGVDGVLWPGGVAPGGGTFPDNSTGASEFLIIF